MVKRLSQKAENPERVVSVRVREGGPQYAKLWKRTLNVGVATDKGYYLCHLGPFHLSQFLAIDAKAPGNALK